MDNATQLNDNVLRGKFTLPTDAQIINVCELEDSIKDKIAAESEDDIAITRASVRATSRVVNADFGELIKQFRTPTTIPSAIANYCKADPEQAEQVFDDALPIIIDLVRSSILVSEHHEVKKAVEFRFKQGDVIAQYTVQQRLQLFADSEVYQVRDADGQAFALKIVGPNCAPAILEQLQQEAQTIRLLPEHSSLKLIEQGVFQACFWFACTWVQGSRIDKVAEEYRNAQNWAALHELFLRVLKQYDNLHQAGLMHGDIHPGNILVDHHNQPHILDFGNAVTQEHIDQGHKVRRGGVAFYYEPEYAQSVINRQRPPAPTPHSEQFALSALLYFLATGNYYDDFELEHGAMYQAIAQAKPKAFEAQGQQAWPDLERVLHIGLSVDIEDRYVDLTAMLADLEQCQLPNTALAKQADDRQIDDFIAHVERLVCVDQAQFNTPFEHGPCCSVNGGAAGIAYALLKFAAHRENPDLLAQAEMWFARARAEQHREDAFKNSNYSKEYEMVGCVSTHHAEPGISFIGQLLSLSKNDYNRFQAEFTQFLQEVAEPCDTFDTTLGKLSTVLSILELIQHLKHSEAEPAIELLQETGNAFMLDVWQKLDSDQVIGEHSGLKNLGFAHGWAGVLYASLLWHKETSSDLPKPVFSRLKELTTCLFPSGRGVALDWIDEAGNSMGAMPGWCNGTAGLVHLYCLAWELTQDPQWFDIAERLAWNVWEANSAPVDLCCGMAGRIFALLRFSQCSSTPEAWLQRSRSMANLAVAQADKIDDEEHPKHSLFKGQLGLALACQSINADGRIAMPMMGVA